MVLNRYVVRFPPGMLGNQFVDAQVPRIIRVRPIPVHDHLFVFKSGMQRQLPDPLFGVACNPLEQPLEMPAHPRDCLGFKQLRVVLQ